MQSTSSLFRRDSPNISLWHMRRDFAIIDTESHILRRDFAIISATLRHASASGTCSMPRLRFDAFQHRRTAQNKTSKANARASRASGNDACAQPAIGERSSTDSFWQRCQLLILSKYCARTSLWQCAVHGWLASNIQERCLRNSSPWPSLATGSDENAHLSVASIEQRCSRCSLVSVVEISKKERLRKSSNLEFWR